MAWNKHNPKAACHFRRQHVMFGTHTTTGRQVAKQQLAARKMLKQKRHHSARLPIQVDLLLLPLEWCLKHKWGSQASDTWHLWCWVEKKRKLKIEHNTHTMNNAFHNSKPIITHTMSRTCHTPFLLQNSHKSWRSMLLSFCTKTRPSRHVLLQRVLL